MRLPCEMMLGSMAHPFSPSAEGSIFRRYQWPVSWISLPDVGDPPYVLGFKLLVTQPQDALIRVFVTADERYELYLDGELIARGPERGSPEAWYYAALDINVKAGDHVLFARVWALGDSAPCAQMTVQPGFLLGVEESSAGLPDAGWSTGLAPWEVKRLEGYAWPAQPLDSFTGRRICLDGRLYPWGIELGRGTGWARAVINSKAFVAHPWDAPQRPSN